MLTPQELAAPFHRPAGGGSRMKTREEAVGESGDRRRRCQDFHVDPAGPHGWSPPAVEREPLQMLTGDQAGFAGRTINDDGTRGDGIDRTGEEDPVVSPDKPAATSVSLGGDSPGEVWRQEDAPARGRSCDRTPKREVVGTSTQPTWPVAGRQGDRIVKEEQRRPGPRSIERMPPIPVLEATCDPQRAAVMAHNLASIVDQAPPVPGEQPVRRDVAKITPRINPVPASHASSTLGERRRPFSSLIGRAGRCGRTRDLSDLPPDQHAGVTALWLRK